jgi:3',5'-cyclic-AMP phosphodiesterase
MSRRIESLVSVIMLMLLWTGLPALADTASVAPNRGETHFRFVVLADCRGKDQGVNSPVMRQILGEIKKLQPQPSFAVIPGDLVTGNPNPKLLKQQMLHFRQTITGFYPLAFYYLGIGNHETTHETKGEKFFEELFVEQGATFLCGYHKSVYFIDRGSARLFMLNSDHPGEMHTISAGQLKWVKAHVDPAKKHNIFFVHEPSYPTSYNIGNSLDFNPYLRNMFWNLVDSLPGAILFCGHEHFYSRRHIDRTYSETVEGREFRYKRSVYQVTVGGFGAPLSSGYDTKDGVDVLPIGEYHFAVVDVSEDAIKVKVQNIEGKVLDDFTVSQETDRPAP